MSKFDEWFESMSFGGDAWGDFRKCHKKIQKLEKALEVARECNRFYADKNNYIYRESDNGWKYYYTLKSDRCGISDRYQERESYAGRLARQTEKQIKEILGE